MSLVLQSARIVSDELLIEVRLNVCGDAHVSNATVDRDCNNRRWHPSWIPTHLSPSPVLII
jgi:hypothetical protein